MNKKSSNTRTQLILAANQLIIREGIASLTLDAVAQNAGVSKGGLLYHFESKEALIAGMIDFYIQQFETRLQARLPAEGAAPAEWMRAYLLASLEPAPGELDVSAGLMAAVAVNPALLLPLREHYAAWQGRFDEAQDPALAFAVRLAIDGWWIGRLLGLAEGGAERLDALRDTLLRLIEEAS